MTRAVRTTPASYRGKRLFDLVGALPLLILLSPVMLIVGLLVRLRLGSPVVFTQERAGVRGQPFTIYKFRTMVDTRDASGTLLPGAQRTPPLGRRLRALSLDELPELWNVLKGEMSLVGPRPLMLYYLPRYNATQMRRHEVKPGITGLAQVSGRNAISWEEKFDLDVQYVDDQSLRRDVEILLRTAWMVVTRKGIRYAEGVDMPEFLGTDARSAETSPA